MTDKNQQLQNRALNTAGPLNVALIGVLVILCGLALSMGFHRQSMISFFTVLGMLIFARLITRLLSD